MARCDKTASCWLFDRIHESVRMLPVRLYSTLFTLKDVALAGQKKTNSPLSHFHASQLHCLGDVEELLCAKPSSPPPRFAPNIEIAKSKYLKLRLWDNNFDKVETVWGFETKSNNDLEFGWQLERLMTKRARMDQIKVEAVMEKIHMWMDGWLTFVVWPRRNSTMVQKRNPKWKKWRLRLIHQVVLQGRLVQLWRLHQVRWLRITSSSQPRCFFSENSVVHPFPPSTGTSSQEKPRPSLLFILTCHDHIVHVDDQSQGLLSTGPYCWSFSTLKQATILECRLQSAELNSCSFTLSW